MINLLAIALAVVPPCSEPQPEEQPPHLTWEIFSEQVYTEEERKKLEGFAQEKSEQHIESKFMFE